MAEAIWRIKNNKSRGNSAYPLDWLKNHECSKFYEALAHLAKVCLNNRVPASLNSMLYMPLFKKGDRANSDCYRGISLIHPLGKDAKHDQCCENLSANCSSWDCEQSARQAFVRSIEQKTMHSSYGRSSCQCKLSKWSTYICFVDLRKAYDTIPRVKLLRTFIDRLGISTSIVAAVLATKLYTDITAGVVIGNDLSPEFDLNEGVR